MNPAGRLSTPSNIVLSSVSAVSISIRHIAKFAGEKWTKQNMPLKIKVTLSSKFSSVISPAFYHARYHNSVCKLCGRRVYIFKEMSPLLLASHGSNLPKYNKQGINYHVITPNCLLWHNSNQDGPPPSCLYDENDGAADE